MELEAVEPAHAALPAPGRVPKDFVPWDAQVVADRQRRGVHESDPGTRAEAGVQVAPERDERLALQLDEPSVAHQPGEVPGEVLRDVPRVEVVLKSR